MEQSQTRQETVFSEEVTSGYSTKRYQATYSTPTEGASLQSKRAGTVGLVPWQGLLLVSPWTVEWRLIMGEVCCYFCVKEYDLFI